MLNLSPFLTSFLTGHLSVVPGVLGIKVKIMLPWDQTGKIGPKKPLPDHVTIVEPKEEELPKEPYSETKEKPVEPAPVPPPQA